MNKDFDKNVYYNLLKLISNNHKMSQRDMSQKMGVSLGKINFCLTGLVEKGFIKLENFKGSNNRMRYAYILTPTGIEEKIKLTYSFLKGRLKEYSDIKHQISKLYQELEIENPETLASLDFEKVLKNL